MNKNDYVFALDIGTRTVVGIILESTEDIYQIKAVEVLEHETRAMLDGQIHNVTRVAQEVDGVKSRLEKSCDIRLREVTAAAAGRALKTITVEDSLNFEAKKYIEEKDIKRLEYSGIQKAQRMLAEENNNNNLPADYHFVGYSVIEYKLDNIFLKNLTGQRGKSISVKLVATFLPRIVIDSLLSVMNKCDLDIHQLTLEPIAAADLVIPRNMSSFNLALVDIGAGTADIALTKGGSMIGYAMVPVAGDEITESLAEHYMLEYNKAERVKKEIKDKKIIKTRNILGKEISIKKEEALEAIRPEVKKLASLVSKEILNINRGSPQAVICIGGGSLTPFLPEELAKQLEIPMDRIGVRGTEDLDKVEGEIKELSGSQSLTPIAIAVNGLKTSSRSLFIEVEVNDNPVQVFSLDETTISDVLLSADLDVKKLNPKPGRGLTCTVNGELKSIAGTLGKPGKVKLNGEDVDLETEVKKGDNIKFIPGEKGKDAEAKIKEILPQKFFKNYNITVNGNPVQIRAEVYQNNKLVDPEKPIKDGAEIEHFIPETIGEGLAQLFEVDADMINNEFINFTLNGDNKKVPVSHYIVREKGRLIDTERPLEDDLDLEVKENEKTEITIADICNINKEKDKIGLVFNGSHLEIPASMGQIKCNGRKVDPDYVIKPGDNIINESSKLKISNVFSYINYNLSDKMKEDMSLYINGEPADFTREVKEGDRIKVEIS